jgi:hypothetical protein
VAHLLHTPLDVLMQMEWEEVMAWHREAAAITKHLRGTDTP